MIKTQAEARRIFREEIKPMVIEQYGKNDTAALDEAWNDWTDSLCKSRVISDAAYMKWTRA